MAIYHLSVKTVNRSSGRSAVAAAAYRSREALTNTATSERHCYKNKEDHRITMMALPKGVPIEMKNKQLLWSMAEEAETRKNANTAREFEVALPVELSKELQNNLAFSFAYRHLVSRGMITQISIHEGKEKNPHAHIMATTREYDVQKKHFGKKGIGWDKKDTLKEIRAEWATLANSFLREAGINKTIDHRTLKEQGINRPAQIHQGPAVTAMSKRGKHTAIAEHNKKCKAMEKPDIQQKTPEIESSRGDDRR